jgi:protein O-GlcNAc transferase
MHQSVRGHGKTLGPQRRRRDERARLEQEAALCLRRGDLPGAEKAYRELIALGAADADVYNNLAAIYDRRGGDLDQEVELLTKAVELVPGSTEYRANLLKVLNRKRATLVRERRFAEAVPVALRVVQLSPDSAEAHRELGSCCAKCGKLEEAVKHFTRAINLAPTNAGYYNDLGLALYDLRCLAEAQGAFQEVLRLEPNSAVAYTHLGLLASLTGLSGVAVSMLERAVKVDPKCAGAHTNLALFLRDQGELKRCRHHYQEALRLEPSSLSALSGHLLSLLGDPEADPAWVGDEHRRFDALVRRNPRQVTARDLDPSRRLKIGYLSPDFRAHSVAFFIVPLLENRDREQTEVVCYMTGVVEDEITASARRNSDAFKRVYRMSDAGLAEMIAKDGIDILVELSGHTAENRLAMLGNRVAPVQVTYLGYANTTGLSEMDYRITDAIADPVGVTDAWHTEKLVRMAGGFLAYKCPFQPSELPVVSLPVETAGRITFGSFNNLAKINDVVLDAWAEILAQVPNSELVLKARGLRSDKVQERIMEALVRRGVDGGRVRLLLQERSSDAHLALYNKLDIALDTFPYNGTTTTCEALWMGTPVVTFEGRSHAGRVGASILQRAGLGELVAPDLAGYIQTAVQLAGDRDRLAGVRSGLRERFLSSPVMDAARLARELESAYREMWKTYCASAEG